jgi:intracellular multiplication protein IcmV
MKKFLGRVFKVKEWADWERNKSNFEYVKDLFEKLFMIQKVDSDVNNFTSVVKRYNLNEEKMNQQQQIFKFLWMIFFVIACVIIGISCYQFFEGHLMVGSVTFCISLIAWVLSFRFHFYLTLIRYKRLDCTIRDWFELNFKK